MFPVQYNGKFHNTRYLVGDEVQLISGAHVWIKGIFFDRPDGRIFEVYDHYASWFVPETAIHRLTFKGKLHKEMEADLYGS